MPFGGALTIGVVGAGLAGGLASSMINSGAQQSIAEQQLQYQKDNRGLAMGFAAPTGSELFQLQQGLQNQQRYYQIQQAAYDRDSRLLDSIDPAARSLGHNLLQLSSGQEASILAPMKTQIALQRQQLVSHLRDQLGPGFESSTAGSYALTNFDQQAAMSLQSAQQNAMGLTGGLLNSTVGNINSLNQGNNQSAMTMQDLIGSNNSMSGNIQNRQISAANQTNLAPYGGASSIGALAGSQSGMNLGGAVAGMGMQYGMAQMYGNSLRGAPGTAGGASGGAGVPYSGGGGFNMNGSNTGSYFGGSNPYAGGGSQFTAPSDMHSTAWGTG